MSSKSVRSPSTHVLAASAPSTQRTARVGRNSNRLVILGAGADVPLGLPTTIDLARHIFQFTETDGAPVDRALRDRLKPLRFRLAAVVGDVAERLVQRLFEEPARYKTALTAIRDKVRTSEGVGPVGDCLDLLCKMAESNLATPDLERRLAEIANFALDDSEPTFLLDPSKLALDPVVKKALRTTFAQVQLFTQLTSNEREFVGDVVAATSTIEELLAALFPPFAATGLLYERRRYLYVAWMLWAFLRVRTVDIVQAGTPSVCRLLSAMATPVISFNYTDFFNSAIQRTVCHFHGTHRAYLRMDTREEVVDDPVFNSAAAPMEIAALIRDHLRLDVSAGDRLDLPALVPPLSFKPLLSPARLETWAQGQEMISRADHILIVGYSFAQADAHFNSLLRMSSPNARFTVVDIEPAVPARRLARALGVEEVNDVVSVGVSDYAHERRIKEIRASAADLTIDFIQRLLA